MHDLVIASTAIRRDAEGRYSLNDLHRASGGEAKHQPAFWLRNAQTQALIEELTNSANLQSSPVNTEEGRGGGTYAVESLVVAYASWISPKFHLDVINTFLAVKKSNVRALPSYVEDGCTLIESATRLLHLAPSTTLGMYQRLGAKTGHQDILPAYAVDAVDGGDSSEETKSLTELLKLRHFAETPQTAYKQLGEFGIVERKTRRASRGTKGFWCLTEKGLKYGKNLAHPENPRQTQPHFYVSRFDELARLVGLRKSAA